MTSKDKHTVNVILGVVKSRLPEDDFPSRELIGLAQMLVAPDPLKTMKAAIKESKETTDA